MGTSPAPALHECCSTFSPGPKEPLSFSHWPYPGLGPSLRSCSRFDSTPRHLTLVPLAISCPSQPRSHPTGDSNTESPGSGIGSEWAWGLGKAVRGGVALVLMPASFPGKDWRPGWLLPSQFCTAGEARRERLALLPALLREQGTGLHGPQGEPGACLGPAAPGERRVGQRQRGPWRRMIAAWRWGDRQVRSGGAAGPPGPPLLGFGAGGQHRQGAGLHERSFGGEEEHWIRSLDAWV